MQQVKTGALIGGASTAVALAGLLMYLKSNTTDLERDVNFLWTMLKVKRTIDDCKKRNFTASDLFGLGLQANPDGEAIRFLDGDDDSFRSYTYREVEMHSNRVANWALSQNFKKGDVVALMMDNRPEFIWIWLGLSKVGVLSSLINTNLKGSPLQHSLGVCKAKAYIIGAEHVAAVDEVRGELKGTFYCSGGTAASYVSFEKSLESANGAPPRHPPLSITDPLLYIYTSGTTGNPKASVIKHVRFLSVGVFFSTAMNTTKDDRVYCCLPLYHSAAGMVGVGLAWARGSTLVLRRKFSASKFFPDCAKHDCTVVQYIGELFRFLLHSPPTEFDTKHKIRAAVGNGLRPEVWAPFQQRFKLPHYFEFYGSTEGNAALLNDQNKIGAIGFLSPLLQKLYPLKLVRFDIEKEEPIRDKNGFCIPCKTGEVGELLGLIDDNDPTRAFDGYTDAAATQKKIMTNVLVKGDKYFRSGDLVRIDEEGFVYFVDRIGDTFRWKGENVSTNEVMEVLSVVKGVQEANVYGIQIQNQDGRAGMATLVVDDSFDLDTFYQHAKKNLPTYAAPLIIRLQKEMDHTGTFKLKKTDLVQEGFDPEKVKDPLYFRDDAAKKFVPITKELYEAINTGRAKL